jgi:aminopeptidase N
VILSALSDKHWDIRLTAIENSMTLVESQSGVLKDQLVSLARTDPKSLVRGNAIKSLALHFPLDSLHSTQEDPVLPVFKEALADNSYLVIGEALKGIASRNKDLAFTTIDNLDKVTQNKLLLDIADIYAKQGSKEANEYFTSTYPQIERSEQYGFINIYISYLVNQNDSVINKGLVVLEDAATNHPDWWTRVSAIYGLTTIYTMYDQVMQGITINNGADKESNTDNALQKIKSQKEKITTLLSQIKDKEQDTTVLDLWDRITPKL